MRSAYKVVTRDRKSLGLRGNDNIVKYPVNRWKTIKNPISGKCDEGGFWCCASYSNALKLRKYMIEKHNMLADIWLVKVKNILYRNKYRLKVEGIKLDKYISVMYGIVVKEEEKCNMVV